MSLYIKILSCFLLLNIFNTSLFCNSNIKNCFTNSISNNDLENLQKGNTIIRKVDNPKNLSLSNLNSDTDKLLTSIKELKPAYLVEIIKIIPYEKEKNLLQKIYSILENIESYKGIPYYSERNDLWVDLYSEAKILKKSNSTTNTATINQVATSTPNSAPSKTDIDAYFFMEPFEDINARITIEKNPLTKSIYYSNVNTSNIKYKNVTCIKVDKMHSNIYVTKQGDYWLLYGVGAVNAPKVPFLSSRIELSFVNRIKTFCNFVFSSIKV